VVELIEAWGSDELIAKIAKVSRGERSQKSTKDMIDMLMRLGHASVFEFAGATFKVETSIMVARQFMRHRLFSFLERSLRYVKLQAIEYNIDRFYGHERDIKETVYFAFEMYEKLLSKGVPAEVARQVLPLATSTVFIVSGNLRNWLHFLKLRTANDAQYEIRQVAKEIQKSLSKKFPITLQTFERYKGENF